MNVLRLLQDMEKGIKIYSQDYAALPAFRTLTIQREVILYLIENKEITASDDESEYYNFIRNYTPKDLYKVAEYYRKSKGDGPLNYQIYQ